MPSIPYRETRALPIVRLALAVHFRGSDVAMVNAGLHRCDRALSVKGLGNEWGDSVRLGGRKGGWLLFHQPSDGEKASRRPVHGAGGPRHRRRADRASRRTCQLCGIAGIAALGPRERELPDERHQAILISHHPEILGTVGEEYGRYLWRDNHSSPTRIGPLKAHPGLSPGETVARGWIHGKPNPNRLPS